MSPSLAKITREALGLPEHERRALAGLLLQTEEDEASLRESLEDTAPSPAERAWDMEIRSRITALDAALARGESPGIPFERALAEIEGELVSRGWHR